MRMCDDIGPDRRETLRRLLASQRADLRERLRSLREGPPGDGLLVKDQEEQCLEDLVADVDVAVLEIEAESLRSTVEALRRLDEGTYGTCADCGAAIASARLGAVPFALRCVRCQEAEEARRGVEGPSEELRPWS
jgi:DnaK suppressor protein